MLYGYKTLLYHASLIDGIKAVHIQVRLDDRDLIWKTKTDTQFRNAIDVRLNEFNKWRMMANMYVIITQNFFWVTVWSYAWIVM